MLATLSGLIVEKPTTRVSLTQQRTSVAGPCARSQEMAAPFALPARCNDTLTYSLSIDHNLICNQNVLIVTFKIQRDLVCLSVS